MSLTDDPRLTAYALGELSVAERGAFEAELASDPAAQAEVEAIRGMAGVLRGELRQELERIPVAARVSKTDLPIPADADLTPYSLRQSVARHWSTAAAAAIVAGGVVTAALLANGMSAARSVAHGTAADNSHTRHVAMSEPAAVASAVDQAAAAPIATPSLETQSLRQSIVTFPTNPSDARTRSVEQLAAVPNTSLASAAERVPTPGDAQPPADVLLRQQNESAAALGDSHGFEWRGTSVTQPPAAAAVQPMGLPAADQDRTKLNYAYRVENGQVVDAYGRRVQPPGIDPRFRVVPEPHLVPAEPPPTQNTESYAPIQDNAFLAPTAAPLSTFGVDVDTASFANVRRFITDGQRVPADAVRIEELINYFPTSDAPPTDDKPFAVHTEVGDCPWSPGHRLMRVALKGRVIDNAQRPPSNLVFLVDVSGSMDQPNKLPLVQRSLRKLVGQLGENDRVAIVVYAGNSGLVLPSTSASNKTTILNAIDNLRAGGSTNGGQGIELAYKTASDSFIRNGTNRVILCTDGDFNVGITDHNALFDLIAAKARDGVFLSVCGFGTGNTKDDTMEGLADKGNGQYAYIDTDREADKVFVGQIGGTLVTIAKDVKLQIEFNPATVKSYRLIGYENRVMAAQDFNNDLKDSGDIGAGHSVVALYEIDPVNAGQGRLNDPVEKGLKYQHPVVREDTPTTNPSELCTIKLRFKKPDAPLEQGTSELIEAVVQDHSTTLSDTSVDYRFDASVAAFGMLLRDSPYRGNATWESVRSLASGGVGTDAGGYRSEFLNLIDRASRLQRQYSVEP